jgi:hypothetical protein
VNRRERQNAILALVRERALSTQAEVAAALKENGFEVVQTTVSRDIADLGLVKVRAPSGRLVYAPPGTTDTDRLRALAAALGAPITAPSANLTGEAPPTTAADVLRVFDGMIDLVLDAGPTTGGLPSTVLDVTVDPPRVLREGAVRFR